MTNNDSNGDCFVFSKHDEIGAAGAEDDNSFLMDCYVDTGDLDVLLSMSNPKSVIIGRTGSGKSALLKEVVRERPTTINMTPHSLSLNYIANNGAITFFEKAGVNLSAFYGLLWKHILVVELLKKKFNIVDENSQKAFASSLRGLITKKTKFKDLAIDYLENWGDKFWQTTEERMVELTDKVEKNLGADIKTKMPCVEFSAKGAMQLSTEAKKEIVEHGQRAVSKIQIRELDNLFQLLDEDIFSDVQQPYYITIDMLDEEWVDQRIRLQLIKALIETIRKFGRLSNVKVLICLRQDLLEEVIYSTKDRGFQEEKYPALYMNMRWTSAQLFEVIEKRIKFLVKRRYTKTDVGFYDIFPEKIGSIPTFDYILERTLFRPRDAILFLNSCISLADGQQNISGHMIKNAEEDYSKNRLKSLCTEWLVFHPNLMEIALMFQGFRDSFRVSEITQDVLEDRFVEISSLIEDPSTDPLSAQINKLTAAQSNFAAIRAYIIVEFYKLGLFGIKSTSTSSVSWNHLSKSSISRGEVKPNSLVYVHPMYHRALNIQLN